MKQDPQDGMQPPGFTSRRRAGEGQWGDRILVEGQYLPVAWLEFDDDDSSATSAVDGSADGDGYGGSSTVETRDDYDCASPGEASAATDCNQLRL